MARQRRTIGPRQQVELGALRDMPRDERLRLLTQSATECGGRSDIEWGLTYKRLLSKAGVSRDRRRS